MSETNTIETNNTAQQLTLDEWKEMKDKERGDIFKMLDQATVEISEDPDRFRAYLDVQGRMSRYTVSNALLIASQMPEATRLRTFKEWDQEGTRIQKGSKSLSILEPSEYRKADGSTGLNYKVKKVFDYSQTSRANETASTTQRDLSQLIAAMLDTCPVRVQLATEIPVPDTAAYFDSTRNTLLIRKDSS